MGTRADFYVGKNEAAVWIGSIAWDGYRDSIPEKILTAKTSRGFRRAVARFFQDRDDATTPDKGWPWPWNNSSTTDCSYWFFSGHCWDAQSGTELDDYKYVRCDIPEPNWGHRGADEDRQRARWMKGSETIRFPDMTALKNVTLGSRSGIILISTPTS